jgi:hypothetical protein
VVVYMSKISISVVLVWAHVYYIIMSLFVNKVLYILFFFSFNVELKL